MLIWIIFGVVFIFLTTLVMCMRPILDPAGTRGIFAVAKDCLYLWYTFAKIRAQGFLTSPPKPFKKSRHLLEVPYHYSGNLHYSVVPLPRFTLPFRSITDEDGNDIAEYILPYLPLNLQTRPVDMYPRDFGYTKIVFTRGDEVITFGKDDVIKL